MELLSVIRRWRYRDHFSIREISRRTGLSRNTVRKYLRSDTVEPKFNVADRPSKLDPYADKLSQMLRQEAGKSRKQKRTTKQLHADLTALGYDGSWQSRGGLRSRLEGCAAAGTEDVRSRCVRAGRRFRRARRSSSTGRKIGRSSAASGPNCRSLTSSSPTAAPSFSGPIRSRPTRCYSDAHNHAFRVLGGVPRRGIYDNMRTAVDKIGRGKERQVNARFSAMVSHFLFEAEFCNPAPPGGRRGRSRRTSRMPAIGSGSPCPTSPPWRR